MKKIVMIGNFKKDKFLIELVERQLSYHIRDCDYRQICVTDSTDYKEHIESADIILYASSPNLYSETGIKIDGLLQTVSSKPIVPLLVRRNDHESKWYFKYQSVPSTFLSDKGVDKDLLGTDAAISILLIINKL